MAFTPDQPFPKAKGHVIKSKDWNDAITEMQRLDNAKVNKTGDAMTGPLTVADNVGIGTNTPQAKLHVAGSGGIRWDNNSELVADQGGSIELGGSNSTPGTGTPYVDFHFSGLTQDFNTRIINDANGRLSLIAPTLYASGNVGIGTTGPTHKFHVVAPDADAVGLFESSGGQAFLRLSTNEGLDNRVEITNRPGGRLSLWTAGGEDVFNVTKDGKVGIGTVNPEAKLHVAGGNISLEANRSLYSPGRLHIDGEEILYILNKSGVIISRAGEGNGNLWVEGEVRLGAGDAQVFVGGNRGGPFMQLNDDLWFSDPQNGTIQIRNHNNTNGGTMVGVFNPPSSIKYKKDTSVLSEHDLGHLLDDALRTDVVRYRYKEDDEASRLRLGVITENCPEYLVGEDGESLSTAEYIAMLHGALKALADKVTALEQPPVAQA